MSVRRRTQRLARNEPQRRQVGDVSRDDDVVYVFVVSGRSQLLRIGDESPVGHKPLRITVPEISAAKSSNLPALLGKWHLHRLFSDHRSLYGLADANTRREIGKLFPIIGTVFA